MRYRHGPWSLTLFAAFVIPPTMAGCTSDAGPDVEANPPAPLQTAAAAAASTVLGAAQSQLAWYLNAIPAGEEGRFGFRDRSELALAGLGDPYEMFQLVDARTIAPLNVWRVPVKVNGQYRALIDVKSVSGGFEAYGFGAAVLAGSLQNAEGARLRNGTAGGIRGRALIRWNSDAADFVAYDVDPRQSGNRDLLRLRPLPSAKMAFPSRLAALAGAPAAARTGSATSAAALPSPSELTMDQVGTLLAR
jgi:hypothetical protein